MSGHSKWATTKHKKAAIDAKRGKVFTIHAKMIAIAARSGGDPVMNPGLRLAIDRAKADNVPNANIDRAVKKGTGEDKDAAAYEEVTYEAFGPDGTVFMIDCITDNKNRTLMTLRTLISKSGGNLGSGGSVAWKFDRKSYLLVDLKGKDVDTAEMDLIDCGADDLVKTDEGKFELYASPDSLAEVRDAVEQKGYSVEKAELIWKAKEEMIISDVELAKKLMSFMDAIDEDEDVNEIHSNVDFDPSVLAHLG